MQHRIWQFGKIDEDLRKLEKRDLMPTEKEEGKNSEKMIQRIQIQSEGMRYGGIQNNATEKAKEPSRLDYGGTEARAVKKIISAKCTGDGQLLFLVQW